MSKENAIQFLMQELNASEYEDPKDELTETWECIGTIMEKYAKIKENPNIVAYVVTAYRWGNKANHSYAVGVFYDLEKAKDCAESHKMYRGGNYECVVEELSLNLYDEDGEDATEVYDTTNSNTNENH